MSDAESVPTLELVPGDEERLLRETAHRIASDFGPGYHIAHQAQGKPTTELWRALADAGFVGVNIAEEYGGGGRGLYELAAVGGPDHQWTLFFDGVEVDEDRLIGREHEGLRAVFDGLNPERVTAAVLCTGVADYALRKAAAYANEREVWGAPIGTHQGVSHPLAEAKIQLEQARLMLQKAARLYDAGAPAAEAANMAKFAAAEAAARCLDQAIQAHGGNGLALEYELAQYWWGIRVVKTAPVSREMILNYVAEHSLGLPRSYGVPSGG